MRITFILGHAAFSGGVRVVATHAEALRRRGHEVSVISTRWLPPRNRPLEQLRVRARYALHRLGMRRLGGLDLRLSHLDDTAVAHRRVPRPFVIPDDVPDGDVVVATWWETAEWVAALPPRCGTPVYFIQGHETHAGQPAERVEATWRLPMRKIVVSQWLADLAAERGDDDAVIVANAVDTAQFDAPPRGRGMPPTVGFMYANKPFKGTDVAIEAIRRAQTRVPGLRVRAFGTPYLHEGPPLPDGARYDRLPPVEAIPSIYASCDAWVVASRNEGFGLPLLEAMACRTPVVATPAGAAPQLVPAGGGRLVPMDDVDAMADAIVELLTMPDAQWRAASDAARAAATSWTWDDATAAFERVLAEVATQAASPAVPALAA